VLLAVAAALWLIYLLPNWLRRSEYLATERNAVRLQQTIRVLAETAETPEAVRIENAAKAKAIAAALRERPVAVGLPATLPLPESIDPRAIAAKRLRRTRLVTTLVVAAAAVVLLAQLVLALAAGPAAVAPLPVVIAGIVASAGLALQARLAKVARARAARPETVAVARRSVVVPDIALEVARPAASREWTPVPVPQSLQQLRRAALEVRDPVAVARAAAQAEAQLLSASEAAQRALRARQASEREEAVAPLPAVRHAAVAQGVGSGAASGPVAVPRPVPLDRPAATAATPPATPSRWARMGVIDDIAANAMPDIDGALARRRAG